MPERIQLSRRKGWRKPENTVVVARPSKWGNPFRVVQEKCALGGLCWQVKYPDEYGIIRTWRDHLDSRERAVEVAIEAFRTYCSVFERDEPERFAEWIAPLRGHDLGCWCKIGTPCHVGVLLQIANGGQW